MTLNCKGQLIDLNTPKVMGILNNTPDSFYDGGKFKDTDAILKQAEQMLVEGASFIDLGGYSSRPGTANVEENEELKRVVPIVEALLKTFPDVLLSIDTFRSKVAEQCLELGAAIINDISAGKRDENMHAIVAKHKAPYIMMHMKGDSQNMQQQTNYKDLVKEILYYFSEQISLAKQQGIIDIIIDPGFGFAKNLEQNYELLQKLKLFDTLNLPILVGLSRKSMIYKLLETNPKAALNGTTALHMIALERGAHILRTHDVKEAMECVQLMQQLGESK